jgi:Zn-dependent alcohol dehydrogenase
VTVAGADRVIAVDAIPERLELARAFGADDALNLADLMIPEARVQTVMDLTGGFGVNVPPWRFIQSTWRKPSLMRSSGKT